MDHRTEAILAPGAGPFDAAGTDDTPATNSGLPSTVSIQFNGSTVLGSTGEVVWGAGRPPCSALQPLGSRD